MRKFILITAAMVLVSATAQASGPRSLTMASNEEPAVAAPAQAVEAKPADAKPADVKPALASWMALMDLPSAVRPADSAAAFPPTLPR